MMPPNNLLGVLVDKCSDSKSSPIAISTTFTTFFIETMCSMQAAKEKLSPIHCTIKIRVLCVQALNLRHLCSSLTLKETF